MIVGCDPDTSAPSYAYFVNGELQSYTHETRGPRVRPPYPREAVIVVELQFIDRHGRVPDQDILDLARAAGESSMHFDQVQWVTATRWKGDLSKAQTRAWIDSVLTDQEKYVVRGLPKKVLHEVLDAVGIGLWKVGRLR